VELGTKVTLDAPRLLGKLRHEIAVELDTNQSDIPLDDKRDLMGSQDQTQKRKGEGNHHGTSLRSKPNSPWTGGVAR
jgi:hypothetical protein